MTLVWRNHIYYRNSDLNESRKVQVVGYSIQNYRLNSLVHHDASSQSNPLTFVQPIPTVQHSPDAFALKLIKLLTGINFLRCRVLLFDSLLFLCFHLCVIFKKYSTLFLDKSFLCLDVNIIFLDSS